MRYIPNTLPDKAEMLKTIGASSVDALFTDIPKNMRINDIRVVPKHGLSEQELSEFMLKLAAENESSNEYASFIGGGSYSHFIPSTVRHMASRSEFYTAYTPYQPEMSQGVLQAIFEYQSMICDLTAMDACNASLYDGATALAEGASLAVRHTGRTEVLVSNAVNPNFRQVLKTYANGAGWKVVEFSFEEKDLSSNINSARSLLNKDTACIVIQSPNYFGTIEDVAVFSKLAKENNSLSVVSMDPISLGILKKPGELGVDVYTGEGQPLGLSESFGGPYLGLFAVKAAYLRQMPGRIVGETVDTKGKRGYVLTLQTREQHIRREKAFSNICSNEALCALSATVYLSTMGKQGLRDVANQCLQKTNYAKKMLSKHVTMKSPSFKEFVIKLPGNYEEISKKLEKEMIVGGLDLGKDYPKLKDHMLIAVTELTKKTDIDKLARFIK